MFIVESISSIPRYCPVCQDIVISNVAVAFGFYIIYQNYTYSRPKNPGDHAVASNAPISETCHFVYIFIIGVPGWCCLVFK